MPWFAKVFGKQHLSCCLRKAKYKLKLKLSSLCKNYLVLKNIWTSTRAGQDFFDKLNSQCYCSPVSKNIYSEYIMKQILLVISVLACSLQIEATSQLQATMKECTKACKDCTGACVTCSKDCKSCTSACVSCSKDCKECIKACKECVDVCKQMMESMKSTHK